MPEQKQFKTPVMFHNLTEHERIVYQILTDKLRDKEPTNAMHVNAISRKTNLSVRNVAVSLVRLVNCGYVHECPTADNVYAVRIPTAEERVRIEKFKNDPKLLPKLWCDVDGRLQTCALVPTRVANNTSCPVLLKREDGVTDWFAWEAIEYCINTNLPILW